jgi:hypothetical protein
MAPAVPVTEKRQIILARCMGVPPDERRNVGGFTEGQRAYLEFHREAVFLAARVKA